MEIEDIHTHSLRPNAIINSTPIDFNPQTGYYYSIGIHPWDSAETTRSLLTELDRLAMHPSILAIGECGIDKLRGAEAQRQIEIFTHHIHLAERLQKPLIIHSVKSYNEIIELHKAIKPTVAWIIHGFRANPTIATELLKCGIYLSYGNKYNPESLKVTPRTHLLLETDTAEILPNIERTTTTNEIVRLIAPPPKLPFHVPYLE